MKKILLFFAVAFMTLSAQAQVRTSRTFVKQKSNTEWHFRAGLNFNNLTSVSIEYDNLEYSSGYRTGFAVDFGFDKHFKNSNLYWGMELGIGTRGASIEIDDSDYNYNITGYNIKYSPFTLGYKLPISEKLRVDAHMGAWVAYDFATSDDAESGLPGIDNTVDAGIQIGVGAWYGRFNIDLMYQRGFINSIDTYIYHCGDLKGGCTSNLLLRLGVAF